MRAPPLLTVAAVLVGGMVGCASPAPQTASQPAPAESVRALTRGTIPALDAAKVAAVPTGTSGPYLGLGARGGMVVWVEPDNAKLGGWRVRPLGRDGVPRGNVLRIADAPLSVGLVAVKPAGPLANRAGPKTDSSFLVASSEQRGEVSVIHAMQVSGAGELVGGPTLLEQKAESVLWMDALPTADGTLVLWAKRTGNTAELDAVGLGARGERQSSAEIVAKDVLAWQVVPVATGTAAAWVGVVSATQQKTGPVTVLPLDGYGKPSGAPISVSASATANADLDMVRVGDGVLIGWSDVRSGESRVYLAALDRSGALRADAAPATGSTDEEALVRLVSGGDSAQLAFLAWEDLLDRPEEGRAIRLAPVDASARVGSARAEVRVIEPDHTPEIASVQGGVAALTHAPLCRRGGRCQDAEMAPTFVQFDPSLKVVGSEPMRLEVLSGKVAPSSWGLGCWPDRCVALAALASAPAPVYAVKLGSRSAVWEPAGGGVAPSLPPRATGIETLTMLDPVSQLAAVRLANNTVVGWTAQADATVPSAERPKRRPTSAQTGAGALLELQFWPDAQAEALPIRTLSRRASSIGTAALGPGHPGREDVLVAWSGMAQERSEVFCAVMSSSQAKPPQPYVLTHGRAEVSDVAAVRVVDGWWVGWIDNRHGNPEVFVVKLNDRLQRVGADQRLTQAQGAATGLRMLVRESRTYMVWADAREPSRPGWADIYGVVLNNVTGLPIGEAQAILTSPAHSHSPALAALDDAVVLGFIEQAGQDASGGGQVELWRLDAQGRPGSAPIRVVPAAGGTPTALELDCAGQTCRGVMAVDQGVRADLEGFAYTGTDLPRAQRLTLLGGPSGQRVPLVLLGRQLYYADRTPEGRGRVRRMSIEW